VTRLRRGGLRRRLLFTAIAGAIVLVAALVAAFNVVLDTRLYRDADNVLRERAAAQLRTLSTVAGRLRVGEAPDQASPDTQTWVFAGTTPLEQPAADAHSQRAALALVTQPQAFLTVAATDSRLHAVPIVQDGRRLGTLVVGASLRPYERSAHTALVASLILGALTVIVIAAASWWIIGRALAPVARMTAQAAEWGERDLSRRFFAGAPHDELSALGATFDQLLERLAQGLQREQRLTAEISHELRTPLAKVVAEAELATNRERTPAEYRRALESIRASAAQLGLALDALVAGARAQPSGASRAIDVRDVAERAARAVQAGAGERQVTIEVTGAASRMRVGAEPDVIVRTLVPVIHNAVRYARRVQIAVSSADGQLLFKVCDDGSGIEPRIRDRIFEPGMSGHDAVQLGASGAGLGLPLARRLAQAAGGGIECDSSSAGATFTVRFPLSQRT
jgi:signal transduction histidine kinase